MGNENYHQDATVAYVCPVCKQSLHNLKDALECGTCSLRYPKVDGFACFTQDYEEVSLGASIPQNEIAMGKRSAREFFAPLLTDMFPNHSPDQTRVLDVGCGSGEIVDNLRVEHGFDSWGIDLGYRRLHWKQLMKRETLALANGVLLPFQDETFHFTYSLGVVEHVGATGPGMLTLENDFLSTRQSFARELIRVTRTGGYILITCPNRLFPIDFFHGTNSLGMRFHSPLERLLLSFEDIKRLFVKDENVSFRTLPLQQYFGFSWAEKGARRGVRKLLLGPGKLYLKLLSTHHLLRVSPLAPFLLVLVEKHNG